MENMKHVCLKLVVILIIFKDIKNNMVFGHLMNNIWKFKVLLPLNFHVGVYQK